MQENIFAPGTYYYIYLKLTFLDPLHNSIKQHLTKTASDMDVT